MKAKEAGHEVVLDTSKWENVSLLISILLDCRANGSTEMLFTHRFSSIKLMNSSLRVLSRLSISRWDLFQRCIL